MQDSMFKGGVCSRVAVSMDGVSPVAGMSTGRVYLRVGMSTCGVCLGMGMSKGQGHI
jgi:hypothetical protein